jgi:hypothetical protein
MHETFFCPPIPSNAADTSLVFDVPFQTILLGMLPQFYLPKQLRDLYLPASHPMYLADEEVAFLQKWILKDPDSLFAQPTIPDAAQGAASYNNASSFLSYENMSGNCFSNARAIGKSLDAFITENLVSQETLEKFLVPFPPAKDEFMELTVTYNAGGFGEMTALMPDDGIEGKNCWGWAGFGGSALVHCRVREKKITFAYVMNSLSPTIKFGRAGKLLRRVLDAIEGH